MKQPSNAKTWHEKHRETLTSSQRLADKLALGMGSWPFIIIQTIVIAIWVALNFIGFIYHWDPYPFILLNLLFSVQAAYAAPVIMMSQNRQSERDRHQAYADYRTNVEAKQEIEALQITIARIDNEKLNDILNHLKMLHATVTGDKEP
ncbi:MAG TPA: DUF1003 domain-containing protein [Syntrophales bacterium]|nr:DUF1003 domain-containing protein [Syntrophales bacterium]